jgi:hypothetical protein
MTISFAPFSTAFLRKVAATGWASVMLEPMRWASVMLEPMTRKPLALPNSPKEFVIAPEPNDVASPATVGACHVRAQ